MVSRPFAVEHPVLDLAPVLVPLGQVTLAEKFRIELLAGALSAITALEPDSSIALGFVVVSLRTLRRRGGGLRGALSAGSLEVDGLEIGDHLEELFCVGKSAVLPGQATGLDPRLGLVTGNLGMQVERHIYE